MKEIVLNQLDYVRSTRRHLHTIPETCFNEIETQKFLLEELKKLNLDSIDIFAKTGIRGVILTKGATKTIALRSDIDALDLFEMTDHDFKSKNDGQMHACGHDGHMTMLLTTAKILSANRDKLKTNVVFIFQPAEEGEGGADKMICEGALDNPKVDEIYGLHLDPTILEGTLGTNYGYLMASTTEFDIKIKGKSAHGAMPHLGVDAIVAAAKVIDSLQTVVSRSVDPFFKSLITVGKIEGGQSRNILAENVTLHCTFRAYQKEVVSLIKSRIKEILKGIDIAYNTKSEYKELSFYPAVNNEESTTKNAIEKAKDTFDEVIMINPRMIAEDFSFYQLYTKGCFSFLGVQKGKYKEPLHSNMFDFDEYSLLYGIDYYLNILDFWS